MGRAGHRRRAARRRRVALSGAAPPAGTRARHVALGALGDQPPRPAVQPDRAGAPAAPRGVVPVGAILRRGDEGPSGAPSVQSGMKRLRDIFKDTDADARDEIAFHLEMRERDYHERGMSALEAHVAARRRFGNADTIASQVRTIDDWAARRERRTFMWTDLRQDSVHAVRGLRCGPGFTVVAVLTLALGIGANTAIFSVINAALLRQLPFAEPDRLVFLWNRTKDGEPNPLGPGRMIDFRAQSTS